MPKATLEDRVRELERQVGDLIANNGVVGKTKGWRQTRGAFTGDALMKQIFVEGQKIRKAERKLAQVRNDNKRRTRG